MKIKTFFEDCLCIIEQLTSSLTAVQNLTDTPLVISYPNLSSLDQIDQLLHQDNSILTIGHKSRRIVFYLNRLILELVEQKDPYFQDNCNTFFFLSAEPVRCCIDENCPLDYQLEALKRLKTHLHDSYQQLVSGWQIDLSAGKLKVINKTNVSNLHLFHTLIEQEAEALRDQLDKPLSNSVMLVLPPEFFLHICQETGLSIRECPPIATSILKLAEIHSNSDQPKVKIFANLLKTFVDKLPILESWLRREQCSELQPIQKTLKAILALHNLVTSSPPLQTTVLVSSPIEQLNKQLEQLQNLLGHFRGFKSVYSYETEALLLSHWLRIDALHPMSFTANTLVELNSIYLQKIIASLFEKKFYQSTLMLLEELIDFCHKTIPSIKRENRDEFVGMLISYRSYLFSSCINCGQYEKALHWLKYFSDLKISYHSRLIDEHFFHQGYVLIEYAQLEHRMHNYNKGIELLNQARKVSDNAPKQFAEHKDVNALHAFLEFLTFFRQDLCIIYQIFALEMSKIGDYQRAAELYAIMETLASRREAETSVAQIKSVKAFRGKQIDWEQFDDRVAKLCQKISIAKHINSVNASLSTKQSIPSEPVAELKPCRTAQLDPNIIRYRCLQSAVLSLDSVSNERLVKEAISAILSFMESLTEASIKPFKDELLSLLVQANNDYSLTLWHYSGETAALEWLSNSQYYTEQMLDQKSRLAHACQIQTKMHCLMINTMLTQGEWNRIERQWHQIKEDLPKIPAKQFYLFALDQPSCLLKTYDQLKTLSNHLARFKHFWPLELKSKSAATLFQMAILRFQLAYELHTQTHLFMHDNALKPFSSDEVTAAWQAISVLSITQSREIPLATQTLNQVFSVLTTQNKAKQPILLILEKIENSIKKRLPCIVQLDMKLLKIALYKSCKLIDSHKALTSVYKSFLESLDQLFADPYTAKCQYAICHFILNICYCDDFNHQFDIDDYEEEALSTVQAYLQMRLKLITLLSQKCNPAFARDYETQRQNCLDDVNSVDNRIQFPRTSKNI